MTEIMLFGIAACAVLALAACAVFYSKGSKPFWRLIFALQYAAVAVRTFLTWPWRKVKGYFRQRAARKAEEQALRTQTRHNQIVVEAMEEMAEARYQQEKTKEREEREARRQKRQEEAQKKQEEKYPAKAGHPTTFRVTWLIVALISYLFFTEACGMWGWFWAGIFPLSLGLVAAIGLAASKDNGKMQARLDGSANRITQEKLRAKGW